MSFLRKGIGRQQVTRAKGTSTPSTGMAVDNIDWVATEKVVKVIQLRDSIPEETLAVLKKMLKGSELAPSLISLSVMDSIALNCSQAARAQLADKKGMQRFHRLCGEGHPAAPAIAQLLVNWACVFGAEELGRVARLTADSLASRLHLPLPPASEFALQMRELIQQGTPMVGFQRGMDFLTNFPDFLPDVAGQEASPSTGGTAAVPVPPANLSHPGGAFDGRSPREAPGTGSRAVPGPSAGSSGNGSVRAHAGPSGPRRDSQQEDDLALMRAAISGLRALEDRVSRALASPPVPSGTEKDVVEATDLATRCLSWRDQIKCKVAQDIPPELLAQLLEVNDDLNAIITRWQATYGRYNAERARSSAAPAAAAPATQQPPRGSLIDLSPPKAPETPVPGQPGTAGASGRFWDSFPIQRPAPAGPPVSGTSALPVQAPLPVQAQPGVAGGSSGGEGRSERAGSELGSQSNGSGDLSGTAASIFSSGRSISEVEESKEERPIEGAGPNGRASEVEGEAQASGLNIFKASKEDLVKGMEEMLSRQRRLVELVQSLQANLEERDLEIARLRAQLQTPTGEAVRSLVTRVSPQLTEASSVVLPLGQNPSRQYPLTRHSAPVLATARPLSAEGPSWKCAEAEAAAAFEGLGDGGVMKPYFKEPALRLMSPQQFQALSSSLTQPLGARLDALRLE